MKRFFFIILLAIPLYMYCLSNSNSYRTHYPMEINMDSLILVNDTSAVEKICIAIQSMDSLHRSHQKEINWLKTAIDCFNVDVLLILQKYKISFYNPKLDSITPIEYFYDENFEKRLVNAKNLGIASVPECIWVMSHVLLGFQLIIDDNFFNNIIPMIESKLKSIDSKKFE